MPRNVRNVWIEATIDGRDSTVSGGPAGAMGGLFVNVYQRHRGRVMRVATISTRVLDGGEIVTRIEPVRLDTYTAPNPTAYEVDIDGNGIVVRTVR